MQGDRGGCRCDIHGDLGSLCMRLREGRRGCRMRAENQLRRNGVGLYMLFDANALIYESRNQIRIR